MRDVAAAEAPGRVNLIGEHTDYHQGYVLPTPVSQRTRVLIRRRADRQVVARSDARGNERETFELGLEQPGRGWLDYVQGVTRILREEGHELPGFDAEFVSTIPLGAGVSSSAALCVSLLRALRNLADLSFDDVALAGVAQAVETRFVGAPVGIMDPMATSLGRPGEALFLDTRSLAVEYIPIPRMLEIVVVDSGVKHHHAGGTYATRRQESFDAAAGLGVAWLRDYDAQAHGAITRLPPLLAQRARHIVTENQRVLEAVEALRAGDGPSLGRLFTASHLSLRDDYEVSTPDIDALVGICGAQGGVYGARMTGGGFGGAVVFVAARGSGHRNAAKIMAQYSAQTGRHPALLM
jgi:galactokinase